MSALYFILGCTACGKGAVGRELALRLGGGIISVDSMKIYRRMDIGTAKPPPEVRAAISHHCIDIVEPSESFSVARYVEYADRAVEEIRAAGGIPLAVGGTSLYIKALSEGLFSGPAADAAIREELLRRVQTEGLAALHARLTEVDPEAAARIHPNDQKRIVRALEVHQVTGEPISGLQKQWDAGSARYRCVFIGLRRDKEALHRRIGLRVKKMIDAGLRDEAAALLAEGTPLSSQAAQAVGYAEMFDHLRGLRTLDQAIEDIKVNTRRLAKKQRTWHRRFPNVLWIDCLDGDSPQQIVEKILLMTEFA